MENSAKQAKPRVGYKWIHRIINKKLGKAYRCDMPKCSGKSGYFEWANLDHKHKLNIKDWMMMCRSCHRAYDYGKFGCSSKIGKYKRTESTRRKNGENNWYSKIRDRDVRGRFVDGVCVN